MLRAIYRFKKAVHFIFCILLLSAGTAVAQKSKVDEIQLKLKQGNHPDTTRLRLFKQLAEAYSSVDPKMKFYYATLLKNLAEKLHDDHTVADAYINMGIAYGIQSKVDSAMYYFLLANNKAVKSNYPLGIGRSLADIGFAYDRLDNKQESIKYYLQALKIFGKVNYTAGINQCYINIGSIYHDLGKYDLSITYYKQCLKTYAAAKDHIGIAYIKYTIGNCYQELKRDDEALKLLTQSLATRDSIGDVNGSALVRRAMGLAYFHQKKYDKAISYLERALKDMRTLNDKYQEDAIMMSLADVYLGMKNFEAVEKYALLGLNIGYEINSKTAVSLALEKLVAVYKNRGQINKAFQYQTEYIAVQDSIASEKALKDVTLTEVARVREENVQLEKHNEVISTENSTNLSRINKFSSVLVVIFVVLASVVLLLVLVYRQNLAKQAINRVLVKQKEEIASINNELAVLNQDLNTQMDIVHRQNVELGRLNDIKNKFFSIVSHDLRGPIGTLQSLFSIYREGEIGEKELGMLLAKLEDTILNTGTFLDNLLEWSKSQLEGIVINATNFNVNECIAENITLHESKIGMKSLKVVNENPQPVFIHADRNMINLVIRNLLSNSIKFCNPGDEITFTTRLKDDRVIVSIHDNGPGISEADRERLFNLEHTMSRGTHGEKGSHLGLVLCRDMVMQNKGLIWLDPQLGQGTTFWLDLPAADVESTKNRLVGVNNVG